MKYELVGTGVISEFSYDRIKCVRRQSEGQMSELSTSSQRFLNLNSLSDSLNIRCALGFATPYTQVSWETAQHRSHRLSKTSAPNYANFGFVLDIFIRLSKRFGAIYRDLR